MKRIWIGAAAGTAALLPLLGAAQGTESEGESKRAQLAERARSVFGPLPEKAALESGAAGEARAELGRMLYYDARLSKSGEISCNSCHDLATYGVDHRPTSEGHEGQLGARNAPTVYNAALHIAQFWDGRAEDVEEQAKGPILNPIEMAMPSGDYAVRVVESIPGYEELFRRAFPEASDPITLDTMARAIGAFERRLMTPSRFDRFMEGELDALGDEEVKGLGTFMNAGCITCHNGPAVGGGIFQKLGVVNAFPTEDLGRFEVTGKESDRKVFKVPSLRNVLETAPYFHDGQVQTPEEAVELMAHHQLGRELSDAQVRDIIAFLESLTGEIDRDYISRPELPEGGEETPLAASG